MAIRDVLGPNTLDQIGYVVLLWTIVVVGVTQYYNTPLLRLEIVLATGLLLIWVVWAVHYRLERARRERLGKNR